MKKEKKKYRFKLVSALIVLVAIVGLFITEKTYAAPAMNEFGAGNTNKLQGTWVGNPAGNDADIVVDATGYTTLLVDLHIGAAIHDPCGANMIECDFPA